MVVVLVLVVLVVLGGAAAFFMKSKGSAPASGASSTTPLRQEPPPATPSQRGAIRPEHGETSEPDLAVSPTAPAAVRPATPLAQPVTPTAPEPAPVTPAAASSDEGADDEIEEVVDRFKAPGQRTAASPKSTYQRTTPRKPIHLLEAPLAEMTASEPEVTSEPTVTSEPAGSLDPASTAEVLPDLDPVDTLPETVIDLERDIVDVDRKDESADPDPGSEELVEIEPEVRPQQGADQVLRSLISRARFTQREADVAAELVDRAKVDPDGVAEVLADLFEEADSDEDLATAAPLEELTLFSDEVPRRPGQMTDFAELSERERRRVIIRVLCLLVARNDEERNTPAHPASAAETRKWPLSRAVWPTAAPEVDDEVDLPARRRLARSRH